MSPAAIPARACAKGESYQTSAASTNDRIDFCAGPRLVDAQVIIRVRVGRAERGRDARKGLVPREHSRVSRPLHFEQEKPERHRRRRGRALHELAVRARAAVHALALAIFPQARVPDASVVAAFLARRRGAVPAVARFARTRPPRPFALHAAPGLATCSYLIGSAVLALDATTEPITRRREVAAPSVSRAPAGRISSVVAL